MMISRVFYVLAFVILAFATVSLITLAQENPFPNETPWTWCVGPEPVKKGVFVARDSVIVMLRDTGPKGIQAVMVCFDDFRDVFDLRAVAFDNSNIRYQFDGMGGAFSNGVLMRSFRLPSDKLPWDKVKVVGVEKITKADQRTIIVPHAISKLKEAGLEALTYPEVGQLYSFELTTSTGSKVSSQSLQGRVILLDFWASWCAPACN